MPRVQAHVGIHDQSAAAAAQLNLAYVPVADRHCGCPLHQHHLEQL